MRWLRAALLSSTALTGLIAACAAAFGANLPAKSPPHTAPDPVARWTGCYVGLQAGYSYNRAYGIRMTGATFMPCLIRELADLKSTGLRTDGTTFGAAILEADDAPTLGHFTQGRAYEVTLRAMSRIIQVSWAEYAVPDE